MRLVSLLVLPLLSGCSCATMICFGGLTVVFDPPLAEPSTVEIVLDNGEVEHGCVVMVGEGPIHTLDCENEVEVSVFPDPEREPQEPVVDQVMFRVPKDRWRVQVLRDGELLADEDVRRPQWNTNRALCSPCQRVSVVVDPRF